MWTSWSYMWFGRHSCDGFVCLYPTNVFSPLPLRPSSGIELVSAAALLLLFILNLLLIGRQQRLKSSEMVRRLKTITPSWMVSRPSPPTLAHRGGNTCLFKIIHK